MHWPQRTSLGGSKQGGQPSTFVSIGQVRAADLAGYWFLANHCLDYGCPVGIYCERRRCWRYLNIFASIFDFVFVSNRVDIDGDGRDDYCLLGDGGSLRCWRNAGWGDKPQGWQGFTSADTPGDAVFPSQNIANKYAVRLGDLNGE